MTYTHNGCVSVFHVIEKSGKLFVRHNFKGTNFDYTDDMMIYSVKKNPYIKRCGEKMFLRDELLKELANFN